MAAFDFSTCPKVKRLTRAKAGNAVFRMEMNKGVVILLSFSVFRKVDVIK
jgi:hypothetical protein